MCGLVWFVQDIYYFKPLINVYLVLTCSFLTILKVKLDYFGEKRTNHEKKLGLLFFYLKGKNVRKYRSHRIQVKIFLSALQER